MIQTPRTDEALLGDPAVGQLSLIQKWDAAVEFARGLERELSEMRQRVKELERQVEALEAANADEV